MRYSRSGGSSVDIQEGRSPVDQVSEAQPAPSPPTSGEGTTVVLGAMADPTVSPPDPAMETVRGLFRGLDRQRTGTLARKIVRYLDIGVKFCCTTCEMCGDTDVEE